MKDIYRITICGRTFESRNLRQLLALAVSEKRNMDQKLRYLPDLQPLLFSGAAILARSASETGSRMI